jgi:hypothetical protein
VTRQSIDGCYITPCTIAGCGEARQRCQLSIVANTPDLVSTRQRYSPLPLCWIRTFAQHAALPQNASLNAASHTHSHPAQTLHRGSSTICPPRRRTATNCLSFSRCSPPGAGVPPVAGSPSLCANILGVKAQELLTYQLRSSMDVAGRCEPAPTWWELHVDRHKLALWHGLICGTDLVMSSSAACRLLRV